VSCKERLHPTARTDKRLSLNEWWLWDGARNNWQRELIVEDLKQLVLDISECVGDMSSTSSNDSLDPAAETNMFLNEWLWIGRE